MLLELNISACDMNPVLHDVILYINTTLHALEPLKTNEKLLLVSLCLLCFLLRY